MQRNAIYIAKDTAILDWLDLAVRAADKGHSAKLVGKEQRGVTDFNSFLANCVSLLNMTVHAPKWCTARGSPGVSHSRFAAQLHADEVDSQHSGRLFLRGVGRERMARLTALCDAAYDGR